MHKTLKDIINGDPRRNRMESEGEEGVQTYLMMKDGRFEAMQTKRTPEDKIQAFQNYFSKVLSPL